MARRRQIYEGKAKILYEGPEPGTLIQYFKDDATAFNAQKRGTISGKGVLNNRISEHIFTALADDRRPDPLHPPPQHARAADPPGRDHSDRGRGPQRRRRLAVEAPRDRGRHPAAAHDHRILLQGRRARRPDDRRRAYRLLRLGQPGRDERHRRHGDPRERLHVRHVRGDRHPPDRLQAGVRPGVGRRLSPASSSPTRSAPTAAACGTSSPTRSSTRTASARTSAGSRKPIRKSRAGSACSSDDEEYAVLDLDSHRKKRGK